ncbi:MAG: family 43 glycosylhydrolase [Deltaproteobacteria bacterium]|nr:family 43 glycosylhydrolase [Deltaproteobacteria bacterium]
MRSEIKKKICVFLSLFLLPCFGFSQNPIIPASEGITDPHIRVYGGVAYMTACHDKSIDNTWFDIDHWAMYSSTDLVNWKLEYALHPEETYIGKPYNQCWATDFVKRKNKYYWYFSQHNLGVGVMTAESPGGPWTDPLGKPLLEEGLVPTDPYDPGIVEYDGDYYIFFGVWDFYIAKLNEDMISLAQQPKKITIHNPRGPYNLDGMNKEHPTDDKPFIHRYKGKFYLSWGCFYAMSDNIYGPYVYIDAILNDSSFAEGYKEPTWPTGFRQGRHGSFFEMNNQWYFSYDDMSQTDNRFFRSSFISYVHYKENGEMAPIRVDGTGVGQYNAKVGSIEAEDYFAASQINKMENKGGGFSVVNIDSGDFLIFPNIHGLEQKSKIVLKAVALQDVDVEIRLNSLEGEILTSYNLKKLENRNSSDEYIFDFPPQEGAVNLCFVFKGKKSNLLNFNSFSFH